MKIAFIGHLEGYGGAEKSMTVVANALAEKGHSVSVVSLALDNRVYPMSGNIEYIYIKDNYIFKPLKVMRRFQSIRKTLKKINPDIVICFWMQVAILSTILSMFNSFKVIYSERGDPGDEEYSGLIGLLRNIFIPFMDGFVFQSEGAKKYFPERIQNKSVIIHNPVLISYSDYSVPVQRQKIIVNVGRLHPQKNQKLLINAFSKIAAKFPDYELHIYGDGALKDILQNQINVLGLSSSVKLMGTTNKLWDCIVDSSMFVLTSDYEGLPNALLEAMALGLPCISSDCPPGGPKELIDNGDNGMLFPVGDEDMLADCIKSLIDDKQKAENLGVVAKNICYTHAEPEIYKLWEDYIHSVVYQNTKD